MITNNLKNLMIFCSFISPVTNSLIASSLDKEPLYYSYSESVIGKILQKIDSKISVNHSGGGGQYLSQVNKLIFYYVSHDTFSVESARKTYMDIVSIILETINLDKKIRPYLCEYPFTIEKIGLTLTYRPKKNTTERISTHVMYHDKNIIYQTKNWSNGDIIFRLTENFEEVYNKKNIVLL